MNKKPIGVFDSGVGGLTVLDALQKIFPNEKFLYLGDTARLPYGVKCAQTVEKYALQAAQVLIDRGVKMLVVACNTASSVAIDILRKVYPHIPVIGVVEPGAQECVKYSNSNRIIVLATQSTINWHAYQKAITAINAKAIVCEYPCQLFVALVEEGWVQGPLVENIIREYLKPVIDTLDNFAANCLMLGCTHFPLLKSSFQNVFGEDVIIIDSAQTTVQAVSQILTEKNLIAPNNMAGDTHFLVTDSKHNFSKSAQRFLNYNICESNIDLVSLEPVHVFT